MLSMNRRNKASHLLRDISKLTPYEEKIWDLSKQGMNHGQIAEAIGCPSRKTINSKMKLIREKLESATF